MNVLLLLNNVTKKPCKIKHKEYFYILIFFYNDKFTNEEWCENVTLYAAPQGVMLDFKFVLQSILSLTSLG